MGQMEIRMSADEVYMNFTSKITEGFTREKDIELTIMLLSLGYAEKEIQTTLEKKSPCLPALSNEARDYGLRIFRETRSGIRKGFRKKKGKLDSVSQALNHSLCRKLSSFSDIELKTAQILAELLLQGFEREEILEAIEAELQNQEREQLLKRIFEVEKTFNQTSKNSSTTRSIGDN